MNSYNLAIIGGGASGMAAAIKSARVSPSSKIIILEAGIRCGKKLSASGNGQGNIGNANFSMQYYHGDVQFAESVFSKVDLAEILDFLSSCGVEPQIEPSGRVYPQSFQASSITDCMRSTFLKLGIVEKTSYIVQNIVAHKKGYIITPQEGEQIFANKVILACGSVASPNLSGGNGYELLTSFGHELTNLTPSLVQIKTAEKFSRLAGLKLNATITVKDGEATVFKGTDDMLFTAYGISGTVVFSASSYLTRPKSKLSITLDFLPKVSYSQLVDTLIKRKNMLSSETCSDFFVGFLHKKLGEELLSICKIDFLKKVSDLSAANIKTLADKIKNFKLTFSGTTGFNSAQVTSGGISTKDFDENLMSKKASGIYACGEMLDIDGDCGGYNLMWAFASGILCGKSALNT